MKHKEEPIWQPISMLPVISNLITEELSEANKQYKNLLEASPKPHVLNDDIINRIHKVFTEQQEYVAIFKEQLNKWEKGTLTSDQHNEITRLQNEIKQWDIIVTNILALNKKISLGTIDKIMAMDDAELAIKILTGEIATPKDQ